MENTNNRNSASNANPENHWQQAESEENKVLESDNENWDLRSAEANGFGTGEDQKEQSIYTSSYDDPDEDDNTNDDEDNDSDEHESPDRDWGTVDPQEHPGTSSDMDPSGPGSAV